MLTKSRFWSAVTLGLTTVALDAAKREPDLHEGDKFDEKLGIPEQNGRILKAKDLDDPLDPLYVKGIFLH